MCHTLKNIQLPDGLKVIDAGAFSNCSKLNISSLPDFVTKIYDRAFSGCHAIETFTFPDSVVEIPKEVFTEMRMIRGGAKKLRTVKLSPNTKSIREGAFMGCIGLEEVVIPDIVELMGKDAFRDCVKR